MAIRRLARKPAEAYGARRQSGILHDRGIREFRRISSCIHWPCSVSFRRGALRSRNRIHFPSRRIRSWDVLSCDENFAELFKEHSRILSWEALVFNSSHVDYADTPRCMRRMYFSDAPHLGDKFPSRRIMSGRHSLSVERVACIRYWPIAMRSTKASRENILSAKVAKASLSKNTCDARLSSGFAKRCRICAS